MDVVVIFGGGWCKPLALDIMVGDMSRGLIFHEEFNGNVTVAAVPLLLVDVEKFKQQVQIWTT